MSNEQRLPENLQAALKRCDLLADNDQLRYFYDLYDPETGGFYYSISSRDCEEMTPFSEGTRFVLEALQMGGMTLPDWYKEKISKWILNHQDESDGFFYEDLWGKITSGPRLYRDLMYSVDILRYCGLTPRYPLPEERMKKKEDNSTIPDHLSSREKMTEYLDSLDWSTKSIWLTGGMIATERSLMKAAGLDEFVADYVRAKQNPETGLFGEGLGWMNTNGSMKLSGILSTTKGGYPRAEKAIESVLKIYSGDIAPEAATYIWNPFVLLDRIINGQYSDTDRLRAFLYEKGADIVNRAIDCALLLKRADGGLASTLVRGGRWQQGYLFGLGLTDESDLDGTLIGGPRLRTSIHNVFGAEPKMDYYAKYNDVFWESLKNKPPVVKTKPRPEGPLNPKSTTGFIYKPVW